MGSSCRKELATNGKCGEMLGIPKIPLKHEIAVTCEHPEDTQHSTAKGAVMHPQPHIPCKLGTGKEVPTGDPRSQFMGSLWQDRMVTIRKG